MKENELPFDRRKRAAHTKNAKTGVQILPRRRCDDTEAADVREKAQREGKTFRG